MDIQLGSVGVRLITTDPLIEQSWRILFDSWEVDLPAGPEITFNLSLAAKLPMPPPETPIFQHPLTGMTIYTYHGGWQMHFPDRAVIHHPAGKDNEVAPLHGLLAARWVTPDYLEDITFTALAPRLRRSGSYLVHAFAATRDDRACLLVGPSQSGKTTTGLRMILNGWQLLGNDLVLLEDRPAGVVARPTPGQIRLRPGTLSLLPQLNRYINHRLADGSAILDRKRLALADDSRPYRLSHLYFPQVRPDRPTAITPLSQAESLARLAEESLDRWDQSTFSRHLDCLQRLSVQTEGANLLLGRDAHTFLDYLASD